jgi:glycosyltransferase involved in cell wall biosynthesis
MPKVVITLNTSWNIFNYRLGLLKALEKENFEIIAVAPKDDYSSRLPFQYFNWKLNQRGMNPFAELISFYRLYRIYRKIRPDIILHYTIKPNIYGTLAARLLCIPCINNVSGLGYGFQENSGFFKSLTSKFYLYSLGKSKKIFFQNQFDMNCFLKIKPNLAAISERIPGSGVDLQKFHPFDKKDSKDITFLMASRLFKEKGVIEYIEAAKLVKLKYPKSRFLLLGDIYKSKDNPISIEYLDFNSKQGHIEYLGMQDDVFHFLQQSDCVVLPSYYNEGCPRGLIEAASCGLPIITTNNVGCVDIVKDGYNGFLCEKQSAQSLFSSMVKFIELSWQDKVKLGQNGRQKVIDEFDEKFIIKKYIETIRKQIKGV